MVRHRLACLAWLIAEERLDIKVACPSQYLLDRPGIYHEKVGVFIGKAGDIVAFTGSPNETVGGLVSNFESLDVYVSWDDPHGRARRKKENFERLWNNTTSRLSVLEFPVTAKRRLLRLRPSAQPIEDPESEIYRTSVGFRSGSKRTQKVAIPSDISLGDYQEEACEIFTSCTVVQE